MSTPRLNLAILTAALAVSGCTPLPGPGIDRGAAHDRPRVAVHQSSTTKSPPRSSVLDDRDPQVANLDPRLRRAVDHAARDARDDGVSLWITSGWRSAAHQQDLLDAAIAKYGSREEALKYVSTPATSRHVTGDAVDIGPAEGDRWLSEHGAAYGLCQMYFNEAWHFELATDPGGSCPEPYADAASR